MTAGTDLLTLWRAGAPTTLLSDEALASRLRAFFAARLEPRECYEKQLLDSVRRGDRQSANATFARAGMLWSGFHPPPDLAMSWMLLAALCEHEPAMLALARGLLAHADQLAERGRRRVPDEHGRRALMREAAPRGATVYLLVARNQKSIGGPRRPLAIQTRTADVSNERG
jgi:hypothetical protein